MPHDATGGDLRVNEDGSVAGLLDDRKTVTFRDRNARIVPTEGSSDAIDASTEAAHEIAEDRIEGWTVAPSPGRPVAP